MNHLFTHLNADEEDVPPSLLEQLNEELNVLMNGTLKKMEPRAAYLASSFISIMTMAEVMDRTGIFPPGLANQTVSDHIVIIMRAFNDDPDLHDALSMALELAEKLAEMKRNLSAEIMIHRGEGKNQAREAIHAARTA